MSHRHVWCPRRRAAEASENLQLMEIRIPWVYLIEMENLIKGRIASNCMRCGDASFSYVPSVIKAVYTRTEITSLRVNIVFRSLLFSEKANLRRVRIAFEAIEEMLDFYLVVVRLFDVTRWRRSDGDRQRRGNGKLKGKYENHFRNEVQMIKIAEHRNLSLVSI